MRLKRLNNLPFNVVKPNFVAIYVFFLTAVSFVEIVSSQGRCLLLFLRISSAHIEILGFPMGGA